MSDKIVSEGFFKYRVEDGKANLCSHSGSEKVVSVPETLGGYAVTCIGKQAFENCSDVASIMLPDSVTSIEHEAFECGIVIRGIKDSFVHEYASNNDIYFECVELIDY